MFVYNVCFSYARRGKGIGREWKNCFTSSNLMYQMDAGVQIQASKALPHWKERPVPTGYKADWAPGPVWSFWRTGEILTSARYRKVIPRLASL